MIQQILAQRPRCRGAGHGSGTPPWLYLAEPHQILAQALQQGMVGP